MEYIHQSNYGHAGGFHTMKPVFAKAGDHIYEMKGGRPDTKALYNIRGGKVYASSFHPNGASQHASFEIRGNSMHTTPHHPGHSAVHAMSIT
jgi:hypothetical protein